MRRVFVVMAALGTLAGCGGSEDAVLEGEPGLASAQAELASAYMECYIDTNAYDEYSADNCIAYGTSPTVAVFRLVTPTPAASVVWWDSLGNSHPECGGVDCWVAISPGQRITMAAYYITYQGTPTEGGQARAAYLR